ITVDIKTLAEDLSACRYSQGRSHPLHAVIETNPDALEIANALDEERQINGSRSL
ncbi:unnamed protein product, partial [Adineta steineri]